MSESKLTKYFREQLQEKRASPIDKFENSFNPGVKCAHCGMSRSQHGKGMMDHPFETRKQERDKFQSRLRQTEVRSGRDWDKLSRGDQDEVQNILDGFFEDNMDEFDELSRNDMQAVGKKWSQLKPSVKDAILTGGAKFAGVEAQDEKEFWNTATSGQKRRLATMLDINANVRWEQLTPAEQGSLAVWWDEGGGSKSIGGSESAIQDPKDFWHRKPIIPTKHIGQSPEAFYNYTGNEKLDSRADELIANEGLVNIETTGQLFHNVLAQLSALAPIQNFTIKAQFTDGKKGLIILSFEKSKDQKMMVDILKGVMRTNGVTKVGSTEAFFGEGQKFTVSKDGTMLPKGNYEVLGKKTDHAHSGPWGTFSNTTVVNLETGERHEIPTGNAQLIYGIEFMDHGLRRQLERQMEGGYIDSFQDVIRIVQSSLGGAGVPQHAIDDMIKKMKPIARQHNIPNQ